MNRKVPVLIAGVALTVSLGACSSTPQSVAAICVDPQSNMRVDDSMCNPGMPPYFIPWYITAGYTIPAYGYPVAYGFAHQPSHTTIIHAPSAGGVVTKRSTFGRNQAPQTVRPAAAATQQPQPKKRFWQSSPKPPQSKTTSTYKPPKTYRAPTNSKPVSKPPTYTQYKPPTRTTTTTKYR